MSSLEIVSVLEQKIEDLIAYVNDLEAEKSRLISELEEKESAIRELNSRIEALEGEKVNVGNRIENILEKIARVTGESVNEKPAEYVETPGNDGGFEFTD